MPLSNFINKEMESERTESKRDHERNDHRLYF